MQELELEKVEVKELNLEELKTVDLTSTIIQPEKDYSAEIEKYKSIKADRIKDKEDLENEYPKQEHTFQITPHDMITVLEDIRKNFEWSHYEAVWMTDLFNTLPPKVSAFRKEYKDFIDGKIVLPAPPGLVVTNLEIEMLNAILQKHKSKGLNLAISCANLIHNIANVFPIQQKYKAKIKLLDRALEILEFKLGSYEYGIVPAPEDEDIERLVHEGLQQEAE